MNTAELDLRDFTLEQIAEAVARKLFLDAKDQLQVRFDEDPEEFEGPITTASVQQYANDFWAQWNFAELVESAVNEITEEV